MIERRADGAAPIALPHGGVRLSAKCFRNVVIPRISSGASMAPASVERPFPLRASGPRLADPVVSGRYEIPTAIRRRAEMRVGSRQARGVRASWRLWAPRRALSSQISPSSSRNPPVTNRVVKAQRSQAGAGRTRTWAVSSTVGVQAIGSRALNAVGGKASTASSRPSVSIGSSGSRNQPRTRGSPLGGPDPKPASSGCRRRSTRRHAPVPWSS